MQKAAHYISCPSTRTFSFLHSADLQEESHSTNTSAHKHGTGKYISVLCNEWENLEPYEVMDVYGKRSSTHCSHKVGFVFVFISLSIDPLQGQRPHGYRNSQVP
jgi:hypothetical protein